MGGAAEGCLTILKNIKNPFQKIPESLGVLEKIYQIYPYIKHYENSLFFLDFKTFPHCFITFCYCFQTFSHIFAAYFVSLFGTNTWQIWLFAVLCSIFSILDIYGLIWYKHKGEGLEKGGFYDPSTKGAPSSTFLPFPPQTENLINISNIFMWITCG